MPLPDLLIALQKVRAELAASLEAGGNLDLDLDDFVESLNHPISKAQLARLKELLLEIDDELTIQSPRSARDRDILTAYRNLRLISDLEGSLKGSSSQILRGVDAVLKLLVGKLPSLDEVLEGKTPSPKKPWSPSEAERIDFGRQVDDARKRRKDHLKDAAGKMGMSPATLRSLLKGKPGQKRHWDSAEKYIQDKTLLSELNKVLDNHKTFGDPPTICSWRSAYILDATTYPHP